MGENQVERNSKRPPYATPQPARAPKPGPVQTKPPTLDEIKNEGKKHALDFGLVLAFVLFNMPLNTAIAKAMQAQNQAGAIITNTHKQSLEWLRKAIIRLYREVEYITLYGEHEDDWADIRFNGEVIKGSLYGGSEFVGSNGDSFTGFVIVNVNPANEEMIALLKHFAIVYNKTRGKFELWFDYEFNYLVNN